MTKTLAGFSPIALLPPAERESYSRVAEAIDSLDKEGGLSNHTSRIIAALVQGMMWSPDAWEKVQALGMEIGQEIFDDCLQNAHPHDAAKSPDNPENWKAKIENFPNETRISTVIQAWQAKNHDGSTGGWERGTPDGDRWLTQVKIIPHDKEKPIKYQNQW